MPHIDALQASIQTWSTQGFPAGKVNVTYRFQATYPNTFCIIWARPDIGGVRRWACLDVHYNEGNQRIALGGFWIKDVDGARKPEQDWRVHPSPFRKQLYQRFVGVTSDVAPSKSDCLTYANVMEFLHDHVA